MKINGLLKIALSLGVIAGATSALADEVKVQLAGSQEVPPVATEARGAADLVVNSDMTVSGKVTTTGVAGTMAHIHIGKAGTNGPIALGLIRSAEGEWLVGPGARFTEAQYAAYKAGELYFNVHSAEHKGGEIRGQIVPPPAGAMSPRPNY